ncbi:hypothetical protein EHI8A_077990 [Entamoeba histolytica HM-1:IMSS-B]|uniref:Transmembrane protein n=6 Tax=Entamoeba histolytica TaxID=5759 RepID=C4LXE1_ENTH1|nr:hypothetical protein EHI_098610 [Entamoeba histolytica HM-1:IMSS]EMD44393.1 Hypothetical protein EHI5A_110950 [Entamoeba histolytica KU27]EMH74262.1 hypothetical protein EHI8A_077990 [Entamoeba histolytica HM-1:IMSS-B]ENY65291.1 hypothetical protein EHI7A_075520 [Entamoeba histolytica HM-1:IMSS-A]GAT93418.1 hypothetical protein CL6EHI_098610 [Entamoeba histolytica]EAL50585.1 hypothetical protein EHI_098610 [Entamoeba histolytica HM-1:IMSS]|eukprot:XP_655970.1 hypothetical protein EHI_098610 [Entamoeba histolytica HM-1:IMSS]
MNYSESSSLPQNEESTNSSSSSLLKEEKKEEIQEQAQVTINPTKELNSSPLPESDKPIELQTKEETEKENTHATSLDIEPFVNVEVLVDETIEFPMEETIPIIFKTLLFAIPQFICVIVVGAIIVGIYDGVDSSEVDFFDKVSKTQKRISLIYAFVISIIFSGFIPLLIKILFLQIPLQKLVIQILGTIIYFGYSGLVEFIWIELNNKMMGNINDKVIRTTMLLATDLTCYSLAYLIPANLMFYIFRSLNFNIIKMTKFMGWKRFVFREYPVALAAYLFIWIPGMIFVYALPGKIQFTFVILLQFINNTIESVIDSIRSCCQKSKIKQQDTKID